MKSNGGRAIVALAVLLAALTTGAWHRSDAVSAQCDQQLGRQTPVLLVHGFNSDTSAWNLAERSDSPLGSVPGTKLERFAYGGSAAQDRATSDEWVTNDGVGPLLARTIRCLADASAAGGGRGKVVVVAHSMGGLALRCALADRCNGQLGNLSDDVGQVVTLGTPNAGSFLRNPGGRLSDGERVFGTLMSTICSTANIASNARLGGLCRWISAVGTSNAAKAFRPDSRELKDLPAFPPDIALHAVAGQISLTASLGPFWHRRIGEVGDGLVDVASALQAARRQPAGTSAVIDCGAVNVSVVSALLAAMDLRRMVLLGHRLLAGIKCWHGSETSDIQFLTEARRAVVAWLTAHPARSIAERRSAPRTAAPEQPSRPPSSEPARGSAEETPCRVFAALSVNDQLALVQQMIAERRQTGALDTPRLTLLSARAMCAIFPDRSIGRIYSG